MIWVMKVNSFILKTTKYISDGNPDTIVVKEKDKDKLITTDKKIITY